MLGKPCHPNQNNYDLHLSPLLGSLLPFNYAYLSRVPEWEVRLKYGSLLAKVINLKVLLLLGLNDMKVINHEGTRNSFLDFKEGRYVLDL